MREERILLQNQLNLTPKSAQFQFPYRWALGACARAHANKRDESYISGQNVDYQSDFNVARVKVKVNLS